MANIKSAIKAARVAERRRMRNKPVRSGIKTYIRKAERLIQGSAEQVESAEAVRQAVRALDKAAEKGIIHANNAARRKSRLMRKLSRTA